MDIVNKTQMKHNTPCKNSMNANFFYVFMIKLNFDIQYVSIILKKKNVLTSRVDHNTSYHHLFSNAFFQR